MPTISAMRDIGARDGDKRDRRPEESSKRTGVEDAQKKISGLSALVSNKWPRQLVTNNKPDTIHMRSGP